jgi:uncharacterized protein (TIGR03083 family)
MEPSEHLAAIATESAALADAAAVTSFDAPVLSCPGWTMIDLVVHAGLVQRWATEIVATNAQERPPVGDAPKPRTPDELADWFREGSAALVAALRAADPDAPVWNFAFERKLAFWFRRQAQEVSVHRWDAEITAGAPAPLDAAIAADGIDEWLGMLAVRGAGGSSDGDPETTVHLHCTDVDGEWLVRRSTDGLDIERAHAKGDVAARGTASDLDLYLWGRVPVAALELFGDVALLESLRVAGVRQ